MEEKKSIKANIDLKRPQAFLLGLVVALALLFAALEFVVVPDDPLDDPELLARLTTEEELTAFLKNENELQLAPKAEPRPSTELVVVEDDPPEPLLQEDEAVETDMGDDETVEEEEEETAPQPLSEEDREQLRIVQDLPQFPGGLAEFTKWLTRHLRYPRYLEEKKIQGVVIAEFMVNVDGSVTDVKVVQSLNAACDNEVRRVLRMMPRWKPGIENDQPCRTVVRIPVVFRP